MNYTPEELSKLARAGTYKQLQEKKHVSQNIESIEKMKIKKNTKEYKDAARQNTLKQLANGTHPSQQPGFKEENIRRQKTHYEDPKNVERQRNIALTQLKNGTHPSQVKEYYEKQINNIRSEKNRDWLRKKSLLAIEEGRAFSQKEFTCPYCGKIGKGGGMIQHHFDNCKHKKGEKDI